LGKAPSELGEWRRIDVHSPIAEGTVSMPSSRGPNRLAVASDDTRAVANAGLVLPAEALTRCAPCRVPAPAPHRSAPGMSTDTEVWTGGLVDVAALLPAPDQWQRYDHHHADLGDFACWQVESRHWNVTACSPEPLDGAILGQSARRSLQPGHCRRSSRPR
jgi:hypothetical protein